MSNSTEEEIARDYICFGNADAVLVIVDATCLERNLNLVYQVLEITPHVIVCVNLLDEAKKKGITIDLDCLSNILGVPVVGTVARKKKTLLKLINTIDKVCNGEIECKPQTIKYSSKIQELIDVLLPSVKKILPTKKLYLAKWVTMKLIEGDKKIISSISEHLHLDLSNISLQNDLFNVRLMLDETFSFRDTVVTDIFQTAHSIALDVCTFKKRNYNLKTYKIDKILTSKSFGFPIMLLFLGLIFWLTISGANYPSNLLSRFFMFIQGKLVLLFNVLHAPSWLTGILIDGVYMTVSWVVAVMLPPMAIFFPLFTLLEDLGYLPRIAFNLDRCFKKAGGSGKQALTMCMGFGCNAAGVVGTRIISSPRERLIATLTNAFVPCNGRFPFLITISSIFIGAYFTGFFSNVVSSLVVLGVILLGVLLTLIASKLLSKTILKGVPSSFVLELPPYRKPQIGKILIRSLLDRTLFVLARAIVVAAPVGAIIWLLANLSINGITLLNYISQFLNPFAMLIGLDGFILTAFILGLPANEIVLPIILMSYMSQGALVNLENNFAIGQILIAHGWTILTAINTMIFILLHFPCGTTLLSIKKETGSWKWALISFILPTSFGIILCMVTNLIYKLIIHII